MSVLTVAVLALIVVVVFGLVVVLADEFAARFGTVETHSISTRDLPNIAPQIGETAGAGQRSGARS